MTFLSFCQDSESVNFFNVCDLSEKMSQQNCALLNYNYCCDFLSKVQFSNGCDEKWPENIIFSLTDNIVKLRTEYGKSMELTSVTDF